MMKTFIRTVNDDDESDNEDVPMVTDGSSSSQETSLVAHVSLPSQEETEKMIIDKKKRELLSQYASETSVHHLE